MGTNNTAVPPFPLKQVKNETECVNCEYGTYAPTAASGACIDCSAGFATLKSTAAILCSPCDAGKFSLGLAANCTACPAGYYSGNAAAECDECSPGTYTDVDGSGVCGDCPGDSYSTSASTICTLCLAGYYYSLAGECEDCPTGAVCETDGAATQVSLEIKRGFWRISSSAVDVYECPLKKSCQGGNEFSSTETVGDGYCNKGFQGPLCAVCRSGFFYEVDENTCSKCSGTYEKNILLLWIRSPSLIIFTLVLILAIGGLMSMAFSTPASKLTKKNKAVKRLDSISEVFSKVGRGFTRIQHQLKVRISLESAMLDIC